MRSCPSLHGSKGRTLGNSNPKFWYFPKDWNHLNIHVYIWKKERKENGILLGTDWFLHLRCDLSHLKVRATVSKSERGSSHRPSRCHTPASQSRLHVEIIGELQKNPNPGPPALEVLISLGWGTDWTRAFVMLLYGQGWAPLSPRHSVHWEKVGEVPLKSENVSPLSFASWCPRCSSQLYSSPCRSPGREEPSKRVTDPRRGARLRLILASCSWPGRLIWLSVIYKMKMRTIWSA